MMAESKVQPEPPAEPRGLGEHARGLASEYAHEQGWGLEQDQRTRPPEGTQDVSGGTDYEYGARDFGDEPINTDRFKTPETPGDQS
jgi:hypothetical protein